ncbi:hypothetical protein TREMEDRAFT_73046 [Tremella mesenterica DSM 1558]|uniref:uncharacterized protein n=1 Tax=Tremella mesenterica (strain ATCC 24925 / CBS 8224 / DSM 1558 / NBRC 9311 / NRRL Y-6157 / RJB 2259-6 / UBC 559-6) TaxID=578456 RepID=UPI0003F4A261|nr:uncharacterized protein TREMEDRAFT_73046 [Tremella mesenterica DSM 1558]EIW73324.1 hypothetical protein TREMEDRAFT_73046 [Tremella mesenterica DSM 1558]
MSLGNRTSLSKRVPFFSSLFRFGRSDSDKRHRSKLSSTTRSRHLLSRPPTMGQGNFLAIFPRRFLRRLLICLFIFTLILTSIPFAAYQYYPEPPKHHKHNFFEALPWPFRLYKENYYPSPIKPEPPEALTDLLAAPWAGSWKLPPLGSINNQRYTQDGQEGVLLKLHVFSTPHISASKRRRLIREYSPMHYIPREYRHLIEFNFVLGRLPLIENVMDPVELKKEQEEYGDMIFLDGLKGGENMNDGKTLDWVKAVGRGKAGKEAWWVVKCDDDSPTNQLITDFPLVTKSAGFPTFSRPTYSDVVRHGLGKGMMYGFSWGVAKTIASADLPRKFVETNYDEDAKMGIVMMSLPPTPKIFNRLSHLQPTNLTDPLQTDPILRLSELAAKARGERKKKDYSSPYPNPDPRTGLKKIDVGRRMASLFDWYVAGTNKALCWHGLKLDEDYLQGYHQAAKRGKWSPPSWLKKYQR